MSNTLLDDILEVGKEGTYEVLWVYDNENDLFKLERPQNDPRLQWFDLYPKS